MERPSTVPAEAEWSEEDDEWILGTRDEDGKWHGEVHYWRPDGTLVSIANLHHGTWHGECTRYHPNGEPSQIDHMDHGVLHGLRTWIACEEPTPEVMHSPGMSTDIWRAEVMYDRGRPTQFRWYLKDGTEVGSDGTPVAVRPSGVPESAVFNPKNRCWVAGTWDADGKRDGELRVFTADGSLVSIEHYVDNVAHGTHEVYDEHGRLHMRRRFEHGKLTGEVEFFDEGYLARAGVLGNGSWEVLRELDRDGDSIATSVPPPLEPAPPPIEVDEDDATSPVGLARLIAVGWGGDEDRDVFRAREARSLARGHDSLRELLASTGLDTAPRLITTTRLGRLCALCEEHDSVDARALRSLLAVEGGVGATAALSAGGREAVDFLSNRVSDGRLDLQRMGLTELPEAVRYLVELTNLELSHNSLSTVPAWISDLVFLRRLQLNGNGIQSLPKELTRLFDLRNLHLSDNGLVNLPDVVPKLERLRILNLGDNELTALPEAFGDLGELREIWLNGNEFTTLPASFGRLKLTFLHLAHVPWTEPPTSLWEIETLETLWLASSTLERLPADVARLKNLRQLVVWYSALETIPPELFEMTHLTELRISHNPLPDGTIDALKEALPNCSVY